MDRIEISTGNVNWLEVVKQVARDRIPVELADGQIPLARLIPVDRTHSMAELDQALRKNPRLGDDAEAFANDVLSVRQTLGELDDPWES